MIPAATLARLCANLYDDKSEGWLHHFVIEDIVFAHVKVDDSDVLVFRGSITALDWIRDAEGWPAWDSKLGFVHAGFLRHMDDALETVRPFLGQKVVITGHSLGGARARVMAALLIVNGLPINQVTVFGSPRPAFENLSRILQKSGAIHTSYRNRNDPVPLVPGILPNWTHPEQWIALNEAPAADDLEPLRDHHIELYLRGVQKISQAVMPTV